MDRDTSLRKPSSLKTTTHHQCSHYLKNLRGMKKMYEARSVRELAADFSINSLAFFFLFYIAGVQKTKGNYSASYLSTSIAVLENIRVKCSRNWDICVYRTNAFNISLVLKYTQKWRFRAIM